MSLPRTIEILHDLIAFDTTSCQSNLELMLYIQQHLEALDIHYELTYNSDKSKANLFSTIGDKNVPGLVLSGHTDVVPVAGQNWSSDPFILREDEGKLYGRGSCDMKGFIAVCLAMAASFKQANLPVPIHFAFSYDEEIGCIGVRDLIADLARRRVKPLACVVGEPTSMQVVSAHKGMLDTCCTIKGCAGHSSLPGQGVNAIFVASKLINKLQKIGAEIKQNGPFDKRFTPPYSTVHVGRVTGGVAVNIIPQHCEFEFEVRNIPAQDPLEIASKIHRYAKKDLLPDMLAVADDCDIQWHVSAAFPGLDTPQSASINTWMNQALTNQAPLGAVSYGTEAGLFSEIGIETIVCGPGSIEQAHRPDEYVPISQLEACLEFLHMVILKLQSRDALGQ